MTNADPVALTQRSGVVVHLLGMPRLVLPHGVDHGLDRKSAALLALAHLEPGITRSTVARWLWPDSDGPVARANLRVLLFRLTKVAGQVLVAPGNFVALEPHVEVADELPLLHTIHQSTGEWQPLPQLLEGISTDELPELQAWLERARRHTAARIDSALRERLVELEESGNLAAAAAIAQSLVEFDPNQESSHRELMRLQIQRGERTAALAAYERCRHWLSEQLGVAPSAATQVLHAAALQTEVRDSGASLDSVGAATDDADAHTPLLALCERIERIMGESLGDRAELERLAHAAALRLPAPEMNPSDEAYACGIIARYHLRAGRNAEAAAWSDLAIGAARRANPERLCWALGQRANLAVEAFDVGLACDLLVEAEQLARKLDQPDKLSRVWHQVGMMFLTAGLLDEAESAMRRSITLHEAMDEPQDEETIARLPAMRINLAACLMDQHRYGTAESVLDRSLIDLDRQRGLRFRELRLVALLCLAYIHRIESRHGQARTALALARAEIDDMTMQRNRIYAELYERLLAQAEGGVAQAQRTLDWALAVECPDALRIHLLRDLAAMCLHDGQAEVAARAHEHEARLRVSRCRAVQRGLGRRWLREFAVHAITLPSEAVSSSVEALPPELEVIERMSMLAELREGRDGRHGARVGRWAGCLARHIGVPDALARQIEPAARLHDIGKAALSEHVLRLGETGGPEMRARHAELGAMLLAGHPSPIARLAETIARQHHEHWDGSGSPLGLAGPAITLPARVVAVADAYDCAILRAAPLAGVAASTAARAHLEAQAGAALDPQLVAAFVAMQRRADDAPACDVNAPAPGLLDAANRLLGALDER